MLTGCSVKREISVLKQIPYYSFGGIMIPSPPPSPSGSPPLTQLIALILSTSFSDSLEMSFSKSLFAEFVLIVLFMILNFKIGFYRFI